MERMKDDSQAIARYVALVPEARRERALALHGLILSLFPQAGVSLEYRMPTYRLGGEWVAWASQKLKITINSALVSRSFGLNRSPLLPLIICAS
jgi:hypothetical protein